MRGKVIVVTGALGVLGSAVVARGKAAGATMVQIDFAKAPASDDLTFSGIDLSNAETAKATIDAARERAGRIDALLNIAGGFAWQTVEEGDPAGWDRMVALNLKTALNASRAALPHLIESKGAIVNVGANGALKAAAGMGAYAASKEAVHKLTESMAEELKGRVRVNAVLPSTLDTPQNRASMPKADPVKWVRPDELAAVMLFLASDEASAITGALLPVMGRV